MACQTLVNEALALRASHPHAPAAEALDLVMEGRHQRHRRSSASPSRAQS
jgi:hypothetical protein